MLKIHIMIREGLTVKTVIRMVDRPTLKALQTIHGHDNIKINTEETKPWETQRI